jgi:hypothetical protein
MNEEQTEIKEESLSFKDSDVMSSVIEGAELYTQATENFV